MKNMMCNQNELVIVVNGPNINFSPRKFYYFENYNKSSIVLIKQICQQASITSLFALISDNKAFTTVTRFCMFSLL